MISALAIRFRKSIALFLYGVFYTQFVFAAEAWKLMRPSTPREIRSAGTVYNGSSPATYDPVAAGTDSTVLPNRHIVPAPIMKSYTPTNAEHRNFIGGPTQPEMQGFTSVNANNMVDLFSGDFSYNIPLLDVGGYPVNISYHSGASMDEDASWVGLGWNINPGSITRNMRGLPDDFNGGADTVRKVGKIKSNLTIGVTGGAGVEAVGFPMNFSVNEGIFHSTYNGWGMEEGTNVSITAGEKSASPLTAGLGASNNSQTGVTVSPSLSARASKHDVENNNGFGTGMSLSLPFNSRTGIKGLQLGLNDRQNSKDNKTLLNSKEWSTSISFAGPTYMPTMHLPMTNYNYSFTAKWGTELFALDPHLSIGGYVANEYIADADTSMLLPAYGYLNFQNIGGNWNALTDYNREKEMPYRENPPVPHIAVPAYTYDVFNISGEGTGGMFRAYRGDIGFIADHQIQNKTRSTALSVDFGGLHGVHWGVDLNHNYSNTHTGPWLSGNILRNTIGFQKSNGLFESSYFRNPGEKTINTTAFYDAIGGDDVVSPALYQAGNSDPMILATTSLNRYSGGKKVGTLPLTIANAVKNLRDKRAEVISYLTASEAQVSGLDKYIVHYAVNKFANNCCRADTVEDAVGPGAGLMGYYYNNAELDGTPVATRLDRPVFYDWNRGSPYWSQKGHYDQKLMVYDRFSVRWLGRVRPAVSGCYTFATKTDDGIRVWVNDSLLMNDWKVHGETWDSSRVNLVGGKLYNIKVEYFENYGKAVSLLMWRRPTDTWRNFDPNRDTIPTKYLYPPVFTDTAALDTVRTRENRVNNFRKASHLSEIDVLNPDGRRYVYGIPVYNIVQKEVSFSVSGGAANMATGLTAYSDQENSTRNNSGKDGYYSREETPAYAHSFLLTGILSPDYVDVTGDGISDDDLGDAVKFNYSKTAGIANPFAWRAPYVKDSANYNEGFRSYNRDDKAHYISGNKELWYLHAIESKTMVANFTIQPRADLLEADQRGNKINNGKGMCLQQIDLYSKADFMRLGTAAKPIKTVHFEYSYELCRGVSYPTSTDSGKLTLKRIWFTYNKNEKGIRNPYVFNYNVNNPRYKVNSTDKWGTYKDALQNPGSAAGNLINNAEYPYSLQDSVVAASNAAAWTLDSITLPSGGRIKVKYESDDYAYVQNRRATLMCKIAGFGKDSSGTYSNKLSGSGQDNLYAYVKVPYAVSANNELAARYLQGIRKLYFKINVKMPVDEWGSGYEYIPTYATPDTAVAHWYGVVPAHHNIIWIRIRGVNDAGNGDGSNSPLRQTAINFLRMNLPSKAYPGSELSETFNLPDLAKTLVTKVTNVTGMLIGYNNTARISGWGNQVDTARSYVRLNAPTLKKLGGGLRVKSILIYDSWKKMADKKEAIYGQVYDYTTTQNINGSPVRISSGVASWEPAVGAEENPFHLPIEYVDQVAVMAPATTLYSEEPLGETFYPGASIGYRNVRVRSIHTDKTRSANGYSESSYYTSYDFPTTWDWSQLDNDTKKRYKPLLQNFLRINAKNYLTLSQGFKVELNDMNGKLRSEATYAETDSVHPISYTENFYRVDNQSVQFKHLNNRVTTIDPHGNIDTAATIGKDAELMADMRDHTTSIVGANIEINQDMFLAGAWPLILPSLLSLYQQSTEQYRSAATIKIIQRYGILDSVVHVDKGSMVSSKNLLYDAETGDPLLVRTQNEFNDSIFQFTYPSHWAYAVAGPAYQNIGAVLSKLELKAGKITDTTLPAGKVASDYLSAGDEVLVYSKESLGTAGCLTDYSHFPDAFKLWVVDTNLIRGGTPALFLVDAKGIPFSGNDVSLKVTRSGHRNLNGSIGSVSSSGNPLVKDGSGVYQLVLDSTRGVLNAGVSEMQEIWKVADKKTSDISTSCVYTAADSAEFAAEACSCLKPFFSYLITSHQLFIPKTRSIPVGTLVSMANAAGYSINLSSCPLLQDNSSKPFYARTASATSPLYMAQIGDVIVRLRSVSGLPLPLYSLTSSSCNADGRAHFKNPSIVLPAPTTITTRIYPSFSANLVSMIGTSCPNTTDSLLQVDSVSDHLMVENSLIVNGYQRNASSVLQFDRLDYQLPFWVDNVQSARLILQADLRGHIPGTYDSANSMHSQDSTGISLSAPAGWFPYLPLDTVLNQAYYSPWFAANANTTPFRNDTVTLTDYVNGYLEGSYASSSFILSQGSGTLHDTASYDSAKVAAGYPPPYLASGFGNYYSTYYNRRYSDSTKWPVMEIKYVDSGAAGDTLGAILEFNSTIACTTITTRSCYSAITDTMVNPYQFGILGDIRAQRAYVYYGARKESDPNQVTNIRTNGVISGFLPFWQLAGGKWKPTYDTTRWVWNSRTDLFNRKGFELQNADPLGRYNSGLYGYGLTVPTAVIQNSRYQEAAFDGFEEYGYIANTCDTLCPESRPFDFSAYKSSISDSMAHTGLYSLRIAKNGTVSLSVPVQATAVSDTLRLTMIDSAGPSRFAGMRASSGSLVPSFSPIAGKRMLVSAWVKERNVCNCKTYTRDNILLSFVQTSGSSSVTLHPSGNLIEGWQRYESVVTLPATATTMTLTLQASDSSTTYFDDLRILPYNGEMKSYVYNPGNLRLMAELDENNYATYYEYDDDGTLIRVKKETERGIQTIKETHSALLKN